MGETETKIRGAGWGCLVLGGMFALGVFSAVLTLEAIIETGELPSSLDLIGYCCRLGLILLAGGMAGVFGARWVSACWGGPGRLIRVLMCVSWTTCCVGLALWGVGFIWALIVIPFLSD